MTRPTTPRWRRPGTWLAVLAAALVLLLFSRELEETSPGPLAAVHAGLEQLSGPGSCRACHGGAGRSLAAACQACHLDIAADLADGGGLHGHLAPAVAARCEGCHSEHHGAEFRLVSDAAFALAGVADRTQFDHRSIGADLHGAHDGLDCTVCHERAEDAVLAAGTRRFGGLDAACAACHEDPHRGELGSSCADCHGQLQPFGPPADFAHAEFDDGGAHSGRACADCHQPDTPTSLGRAFERTDAGRAQRCAECHEQPHSDLLLAAGAFWTGTGADTSCAACHDPRDDGFDTGGWQPDRPGPHARMTPEVHARAGFVLDGAHASLDCARCHGAAADRAHDFESRFPGRSREDCAACHDDPHGGEFDERDACVECHGTAAFAPTSFDRGRHARTAFPLHGAHAELECIRCHEPRREGQALRFDGAGSACADCHDDAHRGEFQAGPFADATCAACHSDRAFAPAHFTLDLHARTGFALDGAHGAVACGACHGPASDAGPRSFGGLERRCASCHEDVHRGLLATTGDGAVETTADCAECHGVDSFGAVDRAAFDHTRTGFALTGSHLSADCEACHAPQPAAGADLRRFGRVEQRFGVLTGRCDDCHADAHRGGLWTPDAGAADCAACHATAHFAPATVAFDHGTWTRFPLAGEHAGLDCAACHREPAASALGPRSLGAVPGASCIDCHGDPHLAQFASGGVTDCARCHDGTGRSTFDHERDARFPLGEAHRELDCADCHATWPLEGGGEVVRYRPIAHRCVDCHGTVGGR